MADDIVAMVPTTSTGGEPAGSAAGGAGVAVGTGSEDLMKHFGLGDVLTELRSRRLRSSFMNYIPELPTDKVPLKPRCLGGLLMPIARQPVNEDERVLEEFDERVLRAALTLREGGGSVKMPDWLDEEQQWDADERKKKKKDKKKKKKKKKRRRATEDDEGRLDEDERRLRKKRK